MMPKRKVTLTILCEDRQHQVFARKLMTEKGFDPRKHKMRFIPAGSSDSVKGRYPKEVKAYRRMKRFNVSLITIIDADNNTVEERHQQLDSKLISDSLDKRNAQDRIALLVPKRNIETWIHRFLKPDELTDEKTIYPKFKRKRHHPRESKCEPAAIEMAKQSPGDVADLPLMARGIKELGLK